MEETGLDLEAVDSPVEAEAPLEAVDSLVEAEALLLERFFSVISVRKRSSWSYLVLS